ncbi:MAG: DUF1565 domain-containing protein, partial [Candidatus Coatesbacteria bacterium]|nr:DUF1565 domain-containing protein [Candidatus Coatesbacteria bacterium]
MVFHRMIRLALVVFFAVFVAGAVEACASGWEVLPDLPEARSGVAVASWEGKLFVFGGNNEGGKTNSVWEYDPETMQYNEKEAMPTARSSMGAVSYNDRIYVLGGHGTDDYTGAVDIYYPLTNTWAPGTDVPAPEGERAVVHEGIIYLMGGHNHPRCRAYDIEADTWSDIAPLPDPRGRGGAAVYGDKIYFFAGGYHGNHNDTYEYDIATNTWQRKASIPHALGNAVAGTIGDHIYVTGDAEASWEAYTFRYDPIADSWERVENCNYLGRSLDGAAIGNMLYKFGGGMPHPNPATPQTWAEVYVDTEAITDFYVDADDGDDGNDGSIDFPWKTITHALSQVTGTSSSPKTIHVLEGVYSYSNNEETFPLNVKSYVSLIGEDRETTILDAEGAAYHVIICDGVDAVIIEGLTATGGHASVPGSNNATGAVSNDDGGGVFCVNCTSVRIMDNVITGNQSYDDGGGIWCDNCEALIEGNEISSNVVGDDGGGISLWYGSVTVSDNLIRLNESPRNAGGIYWAFSFPLVEANVIAENIGGGSGGICGCGYQDGSVPGTARVVNNLVVNNYCERRCAGVMFWYTDAFVSSTTIAENGTDDAGSGLFAGTSTVEVVDSILWGNASTGSEVLLQYTSSVDITYSCIEGGYDGEGNINLDPEFLCGYYLSQAAAGQSVDSPCVNAGSASASTLGMDELTTRTDGVYDQGIVDMGYHYPTGYDYTVVVDTDGDPLSNTGPGYVYVYGPNLYFRDGETFLSPESGYIYFKGADESKGIKTAQMSVEAPISVLHVPFVNLDFDLGGDYGYIYLYGPNADFGHGDDYWVPLHA